MLPNQTEHAVAIASERRVKLLYVRPPPTCYDLSKGVSEDSFQSIFLVAGRKPYLVYRNSFYCNCRDFLHQVSHRSSQAICKHILASRLAAAFNIVDRQIISQESYTKLIMLSVCLEERRLHRDNAVYAELMDSLKWNAGVLNPLKRTSSVMQSSSETLAKKLFQDHDASPTPSPSRTSRRSDPLPTTLGTSSVASRPTFSSQQS